MQRDDPVALTLEVWRGCLGFASCGIPICHGVHPLVFCAPRAGTLINLGVGKASVKTLLSSIPPTKDGRPRWSWEKGLCRMHYPKN